MTPLKSSLEFYTSDKPVLLTSHLAGTRYWLCVTCIPDLSALFFLTHGIDQVDLDDLDLNKLPVTSRHCDRCSRDLFRTVSTTR